MIIINNLRLSSINLKAFFKPNNPSETLFTHLKMDTKEKKPNLFLFHIFISNFLSIINLLLFLYCFV